MLLVIDRAERQQLVVQPLLQPAEHRRVGPAGEDAVHDLQYHENQGERGEQFGGRFDIVWQEPSEKGVRGILSGKTAAS